MGLFDWEPEPHERALRALDALLPGPIRYKVPKPPKQPKPPKEPKAPKPKAPTVRKSRKREKLTAQEIAARFLEKVRQNEPSNRSPYPGH